MYETSSPRGYLSEIKECFAAAIAAAESDGLTDEAQCPDALLFGSPCGPESGKAQPRGGFRAIG